MKKFLILSTLTTLILLFASPPLPAQKGTLFQQRIEFPSYSDPSARVIVPVSPFKYDAEDSARAREFVKAYNEMILSEALRPIVIGFKSDGTSDFQFRKGKLSQQEVEEQYHYRNMLKKLHDDPGLKEVYLL